MVFNIKGIDVSNHNGSLNWGSIKNAGVQVAYIKATEGTTYKDSYTVKHYTGARNAGIKTGFYHYLKGTSVPETQAVNAYNYVKTLEQQLIFMLDVEEDFNGMSNYTVRFINKWKSLSNIPIGVYTYSGFLGNFTQEAIKCIKDLPCWIANYRNDYAGVKTGFFTNIVGWQHSDKGTYGTFKGDVNMFNESVFINKPVADSCTYDEIINTCNIYYDNDKAVSAGVLYAGDKVTVLEYYSDLTKLKSNDSFVYVETNNLKSRHKEEDLSELEKLKAENEELKKKIKAIKDIL